jgi:hypothetical protein
VVAGHQAEAPLRQLTLFQHPAPVGSGRLGGIGRLGGGKKSVSRGSMRGGARPTTPNKPVADPPASKHTHFSRQIPHSTALSLASLSRRPLVFSQAAVWAAAASWL